MLLPLLAFVFGSLIITAAALVLLPNRAAVIDRRLEELLSGAEPDEPVRKPRFEGLIGFVKRVGEKAPRSPKEMGSLRLRLVQAGYRREEALTVFFGIKSDRGLELGGWNLDDVCLVGWSASFASCGDGSIGAGEECDDGNTADGDGCSASCQDEDGTGPDDPGGDQPGGCCSTSTTSGGDAAGACALMALVALLLTGRGRRRQSR
jgi:MYXO-CTERM domain-containing protein